MIQLMKSLNKIWLIGRVLKFGRGRVVLGVEGGRLVGGVGWWEGSVGGWPTLCKTASCGMW